MNSSKFNFRKKKCELEMYSRIVDILYNNNFKQTLITNIKFTNTCYIPKYPYSFTIISNK